PDIAVLTNIGPAHDEGFSSLDEKIAEKLKLFEGAKIAIFPPAHIRSIPVPATERQLTWGEGDGALRITGHQLLDGNRCRIHARYQNEELTVVIPFSDAAARQNAVCCWAVLLAMGYEQKVISDRMVLLQPVEMRLE